MIDLSKYRIIDLSHEMVPGEQKIDGHYLHGEPFFRPLGGGAGVYGLWGPDALHSAARRTMARTAKGPTNT